MYRLMMITDQQRYFKLNELIVDEAAKILRAKWKLEWKKRTGFDWSDSHVDKYNHYDGKTCGNYFADEIAKDCLRLDPSQVKKLRLGNSEEWDVTILCALLLHSSIFKSSPLAKKDSRAITIIMRKRNEFVGHSSCTEIGITDFDQICAELQSALVQLGADQFHLNEFIKITAPAPIVIESSDPRVRLNGWLDKHFIGSNRVVLPNASALTLTDEPNNSLTAIDEHTPRLVLSVKPENIILPALQSENITMIVGSRKLMEQGLADGSIQPEISDERWLLGLDDSKLASTQCAVYFDSSTRHWKVEAPTASPIYVTSPATPNEKEALSSGASHILWERCTILFGKHKLKVIELLRGTANVEKRQRTLQMPTVLREPVTLLSKTPYIPYGRVSSDEGQFDVMLDSNASGSFGSIYKVRYVSNGNIYAMKCPKFLDQRRLDSIRNELEAYLELGSHPGFVEVASFFVLKDIPHIIMSYAREGSLETWLSPRPGNGVNVPRLAPRITTTGDSASGDLLSPRFAVCRVVDILVQLADALAFAHEKGFIHADVKPANVLVESTYSAEGLLFLNVKLCDFGICGHESENRQGISSSAGAGTKIYQSPEQANNGHITAKSDVWSLSVLASELLGKCAAPFSQRAVDIRDEQFCIDLREWMTTSSSCLYEIRPLFCILLAGVEASPHLRISMQNFLSGLLDFADLNSNCNIEALEVFDMVICRTDIWKVRTYRANNDRNFQLHKMIWMANWHAEVCRDTAKADNIYQQMLAQFPDYPEVIGNYAVFLEQVKRDLATAEIYYCKALELAPVDTRILYNVAEFYYHKGDNAKSFELLKRCVDLDPSHAVAMGLLAMMYKSKRDLTNAERCYLRAMELDENSPIRAYNYALFLQREKCDFEEAEKFYRKAIAIQPDYTDALYCLGDLLETKSDRIEAGKVYQRLLQVDPNHLKGLNKYGQLLMEKNNDLADTVYTRLLQINPNDLTGLCNYGLLHFYKKDAEKALAHFNRVLAIDPTHSHALYCIGLCHTYCTKDLRAAAVYYEKSINSNPENSHALFHYGLLLSRNPLDNRALVMLKRADAACGHQSEEIKSAIRRIHTVRKMFGSTTEVNPPPQKSFNFSECLKLKEEGNQLFKSKDFKFAIEKYVRASVLLSQEGWQDSLSMELKLSLYLNLAACCVARKSWGKVLVYCEKALEIDNANAKAYYRRAIANEATGNILLAFDDMKLSLQHSKINDSILAEALKRIEKAAAAFLAAASPPKDSRIPSTHYIIYGNELVVGRVHTSRYIVGAIVDKPFKMQGIHFEIEDAYGNIIAVSLYKFDGKSRPIVVTIYSPEELLDSADCESMGLKEGRRICIVNPYYKLRMDGLRGIRVDHREQVILL